MQQYYSKKYLPVHKITKRKTKCFQLQGVLPPESWPSRLPHEPPLHEEVHAYVYSRCISNRCLHVIEYRRVHFRYSLQSVVKESCPCRRRSRSGKRFRTMMITLRSLVPCHTVQPVPAISPVIMRKSWQPWCVDSLLLFWPSGVAILVQTLQAPPLLLWRHSHRPSLPSLMLTRITKFRLQRHDTNDRIILWGTQIQR